MSMLYSSEIEKTYYLYREKDDTSAKRYFKVIR